MYGIRCSRARSWGHFERAVLVVGSRSRGAFAQVNRPRLRGEEQATIALLTLV